MNKAFVRIDHNIIL